MTSTYFENYTVDVFHGDLLNRRIDATDDCYQGIPGERRCVRDAPALPSSFRASWVPKKHLLSLYAYREADDLYPVSSHVMLWDHSPDALEPLLYSARNLADCGIPIDLRFAWANRILLFPAMVNMVWVWPIDEIPGWQQYEAQIKGGLIARAWAGAFFGLDGIPFDIEQASTFVVA